jgi:TonB family protein
VRAAQVDPGLAGTANLAFSVAPTGGVTDIMVGGSLDSRSVQECLVAEISTWQFPARPGVVARVHYPLQFRLAR